MRAGRRSGNRRGATLIEAALVMIPMVMLVLASADLLLGLFVRNTLQYAVREGCRYAVTGRTNSGMGHIQSIQRQVRLQSLGLVARDHDVTVRFFDPNGLGEVRGRGSNAGGNIVQVAIENYRWRWIVGAFTGARDMNITVNSSDILEPPPNGAPPAP
jgi:hypothetical protein